MKLLFLFVFISCLTYSVVGYGSGISSTVFSLPHFQAENGGFTTQVTEGSPGNLEDTTHALFLATLFGTRDKLVLPAAASFVSSLQNPDYGYGDQPGRSSELYSVKNALLSSLYLGSLPPDTSGVVQFIQSLYDSNTKLYRSAPGKQADFRATATALEIFHLLGFEDKDLTEKKAEIRDKLASSVKSEDNVLSFSSITADNSFGIIAADFAGYEFEDVEQWIAYYKNRQVPSGAKKGAFYSDDFATDAEVADAHYAIHALYILNGKQLVPATLINLPALTGYLNSLPPELASAGHAYAALARSTGFKDFWKLTASYVIKEGGFKVTTDRIVQGTVFRPNVYFRTTSGQAHSAVAASAVISHAEKSESKSFVYNPQTHLYETEEFFDTEGLFGPIKLAFTVNWSVPGFDEISFTFTEEKSIGFDVTVGATAAYDDDEWGPTETVGLGAEFTFKITFGTVAIPKPSLLNGDFVVGFSVIDSSNVVVHQEELDGSTNQEPIVFHYTLSDASVPAGRLVFRFNVKNEQGVHTVEEVWYNLNALMVASEIDFESDQTFNFGQDFEISMSPATLSSSGRVHTYPKGNRRFFVDIFSEKKHVLLASFPGIASGSDVYTFQVKIPARLDFVGVNVISFRYLDVYGNEISLKNFNSEVGELYADELKYTVETNIVIEDLSGEPSEGPLSYGDHINFNFKLQDTWSESAVQRGGADSTVFFAVRHLEGDKSFLSSQVRARPEGNMYIVDWYVDPNAVKGDAKLVLFFLDGDGNQVPLQYEDAPWEVNVVIAGTLEIEEHTYSSPFDESETSFLATFELKTEQKKLPGAELTARVKKGDRTIIVLPVASGGDGSYQISWNMDSKEAVSGSYAVDIYRKVDLERAADPFASAPFFTIFHKHQGVTVSPLPFKTEFVVLLILVTSLVVASVRKLELEKKN